MPEFIGVVSLILGLVGMMVIIGLWLKWYTEGED